MTQIILKDEFEPITAQFYERETGRSSKQGASRVAKIQDFLESNDLTLDQIKLEKHNDSRWNTRRNRTELEKRAKMIGYTNHKYHGFLVEMWWVIPLK